MLYPRSVASHDRERVTLVRSDTPVDSLASALADAGYLVDELEATAAMRTVTQDPSDLLVVMAGGAGDAWELVLAAVKEDMDGGGFVPVMVVLPAGDAGDRARTLRLGADETMVLPLDTDEFLARVDALMRIKRIQDRMAKSRRELQRMSTSDGLTGLLNARALQDRIATELARASRYHDPLSIVMVDVDGFSRINTRFGEDAGNDVLRTLARLLEDAVREVDLVGRQGADTFCLVLPKTHISGAIVVAERIWEGVRNQAWSSIPNLSQVTISVGLAFYPAKGVKTYEDLRVIAKEALFRAKRDGKDRICLYQGAHYTYHPRPGDESGEDGTEVG